ncbi:LL-diaminopimelate aminotransferase [Candidatus Saccharibacteria bacterium]|nr:LL-diaminopimelate aminotransferase [Candidatus Saccharibacteria bacterium]
MAKINSNFAKLTAGYVFPEINRRVAEFSQQNPKASIIKLGIGDTTLALTESVTKALHEKIDLLSNKNTYTGYGAERGEEKLREALVTKYRDQYGIDLKATEVFIGDGAKSDSSNIQSIFSADSVVAVQDPVFPVYVDSSVITGKTGSSQDGRYQNIVYMDCNEENGFFPELPAEHVDIIYLCSPNNPTGTVATHGQLQKFVDYAIEKKAVIIFDAAYSEFISDNTLPRSIYEIEGAKSCAIEINSFSKWAGFTGVRLGWTIVPENLIVDDCAEGELNQAWNRRQSTMFNGASNIVQAGGLAVVQNPEEQQALINYYMTNAKHLYQAFSELGYSVFGGKNAPYVWVKLPDGVDSWAYFDILLRQTNIVGTPGAAFGKNGDNYFRFSSFASQEDVTEAIDRIRKMDKDNE